MVAHFRKYPLFVLIMMIGACSMVLPAIHAAKLGDARVAQVFLSYALFILIISVIMGLALMNRVSRSTSRSHLVTIFLVYTLLPIFLAMPFGALIPSMGPIQSYFEMLSSLTTTGATLINDPLSIAEPLHLWRALVAWMGGFFVVIVALSVMEPMNLGGFEIRSLVLGSDGGTVAYGAADASERIEKYVLKIGPVYVAVTFVLMAVLYMSGDRAYVASIHAMSIISTSGISPIGGTLHTESGRLGEMFMVIFLLFAVSNRGFQSFSTANWQWLKRDVEVRLMLIATLGIAIILFIRHWISVFEVSTQSNIGAAFAAFWGSIFTVMSFLTTTGFKSADWSVSQNWSGLSTSGVMFLALVVMGGGVATTAGGVKLLRIYALYKHGLREMERLVHPSSVGGAGMAARRFRREGAFTAWVFFMLFLVGIAMMMLALAFVDIGFDEAVAFSIAAVTNTGPVAGMLETGLQYTDIGISGQLILCVGMVFGRVEVLALIALFNPSYWRR
ncbi:MAG: potassium transporter TrkG [Paracoccaceae bacterium]